MQQTIKQLRQRGYKVRVIHTRKFYSVKKFDGVYSSLSAKGGSTRIEITSPDKNYNAFGEAVCSDEDNFNRRVGNSIALGRALNALRETGGYV